MASGKIEATLLSAEAKARYQTCLMASIKAGKIFQQKTVDLKSLPSADQVAETDRICGEISETLAESKELFLSGRLHVNAAVEQFRQSTDERRWPTVLIDISQQGCLEAVSEQLNRDGFSLAPNDLEADHHPADKYRLFNFLHVCLPPDHAFLSYLASQDFTKHVFDAERVVSLPKPAFLNDDLGPSPAMADARELVLRRSEWPSDAPENLGNDTIIAIIDSGIDATHPDFMGRVLAYRNFSEDDDMEDRNGHGTHVAGIAAGSGQASSGRYTGMAKASQLVVAKVFDASGSATTNRILSGMRWAAEQGAQVMNLSLGSSGTPTDGNSLLSRACERLVQRGIVVCVSAGNDGPQDGSITPPGDARGIICVGAVDKSGNIAPFSSRGPTDAPQLTGPKPDITAPGVFIVAPRSHTADQLPTRGTNHYTAMSGTSMSAPAVTGICAIALSYAKYMGMPLSPVDLRDLIGRTANDLGNDFNAQGHGLVQAHLLLQQVKSRLHKRAESTITAQMNEEKLGRYIIQGLIGQGGFGKVYKVYDPFLKCHLAAKVPTIVDVPFEEASKEAQKQKELSHRAVVRVENVEKIDDGRCVIIMEYAEGGSLREKLDNEPIDSELCLRYMEDLADAVTLAHEHDLVHYDIKPENILFDKSGAIKLTDFGVARRLDVTGSKMSKVIGTVQYVGPEQLNGIEDKQSEVWSLGTVFYEMLTGKVCMNGHTAAEVIQKITRGSFLPVRKANPHVPKALANIIKRMLQVDKAKRYHTVAQVRDAIAAYRAQQKAARRISLPLTILLSLLFAGVITALGGWYAHWQGWIKLPVLSVAKSVGTEVLPDGIATLSPIELYQKGLAELKRHDYELAYRVFDKVEKRVTDRQMMQEAAYQKVFLSAYFMDDPEQAIDDAQHFLARFPDSNHSGDVHYYLGNIYYDKMRDMLAAIRHYSIVQEKSSNPERLQDIEYRLQDAEKRLAREGRRIGLVKKSSLGALLPNNWMSLSISLFGFIASFVGILAWIATGHQRVVIAEEAGLLGHVGVFVKNRGLFLNLLILFFSQAASWMITQYQSQATFRQLEALIKNMVG